MTKKYMLTDSFFFHCTFSEGTITAISDNMPDTQSSAYRRKYYHLF